MGDIYDLMGQGTPKVSTTTKKKFVSQTTDTEMTSPPRDSSKHFDKEKSPEVKSAVKVKMSPLKSNKKKKSPPTSPEEKMASPTPIKIKL